MWREVATSSPSDKRMHVNVATASHIKVAAFGAEWAVVVLHGTVESTLKGTLGEPAEADEKYVEIIKELEHLDNSTAMVAKHQANKIIEQAATTGGSEFHLPRRIR